MMMIKERGMEKEYKLRRVHMRDPRVVDKDTETTACLNPRIRMSSLKAFVSLNSLFCFFLAGSTPQLSFLLTALRITMQYACQPCTNL
jgi:hypothetical protein